MPSGDITKDIGTTIAMLEIAINASTMALDEVGYMLSQGDLDLALADRDALQRSLAIFTAIKEK